MSITDGQLIFDLRVFRQGIRPALNAGLSVSRVGSQAQTVRQKKLSTTLFKVLAKYHQAEEFSHFSTQLSKETSADLIMGQLVYRVLLQPPEERHTLIEQQLMLETVLLGNGQIDIDVVGLKEYVKKIRLDLKDEKDFDRNEAELLKKHTPKSSTKKIADELVETEIEDDTEPEEKTDAKS